MPLIHHSLSTCKVFLHWNLVAIYVNRTRLSLKRRSDSTINNRKKLICSQLTKELQDMFHSQDSEPNCTPLNNPLIWIKVFIAGVSMKVGTVIPLESMSAQESCCFVVFTTATELLWSTILRDSGEAVMPGLFSFLRVTSVTYCQRSEGFFLFLLTLLLTIATPALYNKCRQCKA